MNKTLDDLFQWAAQQPPNNTTSVQLAIATNESEKSNLVSYAEGVLYYSPARHTGFYLSAPSFSSRKDGVTQYFSDRRYSAQAGSFATCPFACDHTDPLDVTIHARVLIIGEN